MDTARLTKTFIELVKIGSPSGKEENVRDYVIQLLNKYVIKCEIDRTGNIYAVAEGEGEPVLLCTHLDTVEHAEDIKPQIYGEWITSNGKTILGADNKAAVAAVLETLISTSPKSRRKIELIFTVREETDGGINFVDTSKIESKVGLVADSELPLGAMVLSSPWNHDIEVAVSGKASHADSPEKGINALEATANALSKIKLGRFDKETIFNLGVIKGGEAANTVPGKITLSGTLRSFDEKSLNDGLDFIRKTFENEAKSIGAKAVVKNNIYCDGYSLVKSDPEVKRLAKMMQGMGFNVTYHSSFGGTDANFLFNHGIKVINVGDGVENVHTVSERISIKNLEDLTNFFIEYTKIF